VIVRPTALQGHSRPLASLDTLLELFAALFQFLFVGLSRLELRRLSNAGFQFREAILLHHRESIFQHKAFKCSDTKNTPC